MLFVWLPIASDVNKDLTCKAKAKAKDQTGKAKAKDLADLVYTDGDDNISNCNMALRMQAMQWHASVAP